MLYNLFENRDFVSVFAVALLAEGVDRNKQQGGTWRYAGVALLAEGVDRNGKGGGSGETGSGRPPRGGRG